MIGRIYDDTVVLGQLDYWSVRNATNRAIEKSWMFEMGLVSALMLPLAASRCL